jgi:DNA polymerase III delta prime subunit
MCVSISIRIITCIYLSYAQAKPASVNGKRDSQQLQQTQTINFVIISGKTTLAQIIAHHAGYRPVLVNASDERTAKSIEERVSSAMQMSTILRDARPACLILDEVEGAANMGDGKGAIPLLVRLAQTKLKG